MLRRCQLSEREQSAGIILNCVICGAVFRPLTFAPVYADELDGDELQPLIEGKKEALVVENGMEMLPGERVSFE